MHCVFIFQRDERSSARWRNDDEGRAWQVGEGGERLWLQKSVGARPPKGFDYELPIKIHKTRLSSIISRYFSEFAEYFDISRIDE
mgnify:CR=1 FL=1